MSKREFKLPPGRLQQVMSDMDYNKVEKFRVNDFFNQKNKNPRYAKREECSLKGCKDMPYHQNDINGLLKGQPEKKYNKEDVFEMSKTKKCPKGKKVCDCHLKQSKKKSRKTPKIKKPIKQYKNEFHTLY